MRNKKEVKPKVIIGLIDCTTCDKSANVLKNTRGGALYVKCDSCGATVQGTGEKVQTAILSGMKVQSNQADENEPFIMAPSNDPVTDPVDSDDKGGISWGIIAAGVAGLFLMGLGIRGSKGGA